MEGSENRKNVPKHARKIKRRGKGVEVCIRKKEEREEGGARGRVAARRISRVSSGLLPNNRPIERELNRIRHEVRQDCGFGEVTDMISMKNELFHAQDHNPDFMAFDLHEALHN